MKKIMIIGSMDEFVELVKLSKRRGYYNIVCDGYKDGPAKKYADKSYDVDIRNVDEIAQICNKEKVDGITGSFSDIIFEKITEIADKAGLKWYQKPNKLKYYREKYEQKKVLKELGIETPKFTKLSKEFKDNELQGFEFPVIVKPVNGWGSKGIIICNSINEIRNRLNEVTFRYNEEYIFVEEYVNYHEHNLQSWIMDGRVYLLGIADRDRNEKEGDEIQRVNRVLYPAFFTEKVYSQCIDVIEKFAEFTGQKEGPVSMQFFYDKDKDRIIICEMAGRLLGYEHELILKCGGLNLEELLLDYAFDVESLKNKLEHSNPFFKKYAAGLYFHAKDGMMIDNMDSVYEIGKLDDVDDTLLFYKQGEKIDNYSAKAYFVRYYISADTRDKIDKMTDKIFKLMKVTSKDNEEIVYKNTLEKEYKNISE